MDNEGIDAKVLLHVRAGMTRMGAIASAPDWPSGVSNRDIDRSLQRLRRAGKITYASATGWRAT